MYPLFLSLPLLDKNGDGNGYWKTKFVQRGTFLKTVPDIKEAIHGAGVVIFMKNLTYPSYSNFNF